MSEPKLKKVGGRWIEPKMIIDNCLDSAGGFTFLLNDIMHQMIKVVGNPQAISEFTLTFKRFPVNIPNAEESVEFRLDGLYLSRDDDGGE